MAKPETLQKLGLFGGLLFAAVAGVLYFQATHDSGTERLKTVRSVPPPTSAGADAVDTAGSIPVGVLGMMSAPRVVPAKAKKSVNKALKAALPGLDGCYDGAGASSEPDGTLYIKLHTTEAGAARDLQIAFRGPSGTELRGCVSGVLSAASFASVPADTLISWPLRWKRGEGMRLR